MDPVRGKGSSRFLSRPVLVLDRMKPPRFSQVAKRAVQILKTLLPGINFITIHYAYFIITILISSIIFWKTSTTEQPVSYVNSLFMVASAMTLAGLAAVNVSSLSTFQQALIFILMIAGNSILVSYIVVLFRKRSFESRLTHITETCHQPSPQTNRLFSFCSQPFPPIRCFTVPLTIVQNDYAIRPDDISQSRLDSEFPRFRGARNEEAFDLESRYSAHRRPSDLSDDRDHNGRRRKSESAVLSVFRLGAMISGMNPETHSESLSVEGSDQPGHHLHMTADMESNNQYLRVNREATTVGIPNLDGNSDQRGGHSSPADDSHLRSVKAILEGAVIGHNHQIHGLCHQDRIALGGVEYRAIRLLSYIVPAYLIIFQGLGCLSTALYVGFHGKREAESNAVNPWYDSCILSFCPPD